MRSRRCWLGHRLLVLVVCACGWPWARAASAQPRGGPGAAAVRPLALVIVGRPDPSQPWSDAPTEARQGQAPQLAVVARARDGQRAVVLADADLTPLVLRGRRVPPSARRPWDSLGPVAIEWRSVEARGFRTAESKNGATTRYYSNVSTDAETFGRWLGYDTIEYFETTRAEPSSEPSARRHAPQIATVDDETPSPVQSALGTRGLGTLRFRALATFPDGRTLSTAGAEATDRAGISPRVHRVTVRAGDDFLGQLSALFLVPEVFGSAGLGRAHQTERLTGADCADVLVGAIRRAGRTDIAYTSVAGLPRYTTSVEPPAVLDGEGRPERELTAARVGDLLRIDYGGALTGHTPRSWDHVAAWWRDTSDPAGPARGGPDGKLDGFDLVVHMGHPRLVVEPLAAQSPATIDVLRWRDKAR